MSNQGPAHSPIGASSMKRVRHCPGSRRLSAIVPRHTTEFAEEGTEAHELAYSILAARIDGKPDPDTFGLDEEMVDLVMLYVEHIEGLKKPNCIQLYEHKFDLTDLYPGCFGTSDATTYYPDEKLLVVSDLKFGAGIYVPVVRNDQLMYYAVGAARQLKLPIKKIRIEIFQPRIWTGDALSTWEFDIFTLLEFEDEIVDMAKASEDPHAPLAAGEWCRFCPAAAICPLLKEKGRALAVKEFLPIDFIDYDELGDVMDWLPTLESFCKRVREFAYNEAMAGRKVKGRKLVPKVGRRYWKDDDATVFVALRDLGIDPERIYHKEIKMLSPSQIEQIPAKELPVKKSELKAIIRGMTQSESSGFNLVKEDDDRPEIERPTAKTLFAPIGKSAFKPIDR